jgi:hypothetical protein
MWYLFNGFVTKLTATPTHLYGLQSVRVVIKDISLSMLRNKEDGQLAQGLAVQVFITPLDLPCAYLL